MFKNFKPAKYIFIIFLIIISNCNYSQTNSINVLTDEISLYEISDDYNLKNQQNNVSLKILSDKSKNIFKYYEENKFSNLDLIVGEYDPEILPNLKYYINYSHKIKEINANKFLYFKPLHDFINKFNGIFIPYSINFPVIIARKDILTSEILNKSELSIKEFSELAKKTNNKDTDGQYNQIKLSFIPSISRASEIEFYSVLNDSIFYKSKNEKIKLDVTKMSLTYSFYNEFDNIFNFGKDITNKYLDRFNNINKNYYLKQKIISMDFIPVSDAITYSDDIYKIFFIKDLKNLSFNSKVIAIPNSSINEKDAINFIGYLLNSSTQEKLFRATLNNSNYYNYIHIPVIKGIILNKKTAIIDTKKLEEYIDNLSYMNFYNQKVQKDFFQKYQNIKDMVNKGQISDKDFVNILAKEFNK